MLSLSIQSNTFFCLLSPLKRAQKEIYSKAFPHKCSHTFQATLSLIDHTAILPLPPFNALKSIGKRNPSVETPKHSKSQWKYFNTHLHRYSAQLSSSSWKNIKPTFQQLHLLLSSKPIFPKLSPFSFQGPFQQIPVFSSLKSKDPSLKILHLHSHRLHQDTQILFFENTFLPFLDIPIFSASIICKNHLSSQMSKSPSTTQSPEKIPSFLSKMEILKKLKRVKSMEPLGVFGFFCFSAFCFLWCFFYLDYRVVTKSFRVRMQSPWLLRFGLEDFSENRRVEFLSAKGDGCDLFEGEWVWDEHYPLYQSRDCSFIDEGFRCSENGRPDHFYTKWRWQPKRCNLPRSSSFSLELQSSLFEFSLDCSSLCFHQVKLLYALQFVWFSF